MNIHPSLQKNRSLSEFSTFGIGGPIRYFLEVTTIDEAVQAYAWARSENVPVLVVGKGSNCLFPDTPYDGLVLLNRINHCTIENGQVEVGAGFSFALLGVQTALRSLSGLEFASGIPATVGGAIFMNAGANGHETSECLTSVLYLQASGELREYQKSELNFSYRKSSFQTMDGCILSARFALTPKETARKDQLSIIENRIKTQPLSDKSAGCVFRNPGPGVAAGALIDQCGLKGYSVGGAKISEVHANFIVNVGHASAIDVITLIRHIQDKVFEKTGNHLEPEIRF